MARNNSLRNEYVALAITVLELLSQLTIPCQLSDLPCHDSRDKGVLNCMSTVVKFTIVVTLSRQGVDNSSIQYSHLFCELNYPWISSLNRQDHSLSPANQPVLFGGQCSPPPGLKVHYTVEICPKVNSQNKCLHCNSLLSDMTGTLAH